MLYHRPILSSPDLGLFRSAGPGLGNLLFPIGRAILGAERVGGIVVRPTVRQLKLGPLLRREHDKRIYGNVFNHRTLAEMASWIHAARLPQLAEGAAVPMTDASIRYEGMARYFHDLADGEAIVAAWLERHARGHDSAEPSYDMAVHVRLGDFGAPGTGNENSRIALGWYAEAIEQASRTIGIAAPEIVLFTDGNPDEVASLTSRFPMRLDAGRNALASIRSMAMAKILVTSRSTFSMWGAYLGGMPAIWDGAFDRRPFFPDRGQLDISL